MGAVVGPTDLPADRPLGNESDLDDRQMGTMMMVLKGVVAG